MYLLLIFLMSFIIPLVFLPTMIKKGTESPYRTVLYAALISSAAALAVFFIMRKNAKMKSIASASGISALLGITEPAVFGVNLKLKYPFVGALIGSAVGSAYATFMKVLSLSQGPAGLPGAIVIRPESMVQYMVTMVITFVTATIATILLSTVFQKKENSTN